MSIKRYGVIYKSKNGKDVVVCTDQCNEAIPDVYRKRYPVLAFHTEKAAHKFMSHYTAQGYMAAEREVGGKYKVIELEPVYVIANWKFPEKIEDKPKPIDAWGLIHEVD